MRKIYLAISEKDTKEINELITSIVPGIKTVNLQSKSEVMEIIRSPFILCVANSQFVDVKELDQSELNGRLMILDPSGEMIVDKKNVITCKSTNDMAIEIRLSRFGNLIYDKQGTIPQPKAKEQVVTTIEQSEPKKEDKAKEHIENAKELVPPIQNDIVTENVITQEKDSEPSDEKLKSPEATPNATRKEEFTTHNDKPKLSTKKPSLTEKALGIGEAMDLVTFKNKKTVGLWAPLTAGVTSFLIDFAIYLQQYDAPVAVVEIPKKRQHHLKILERFQSKPKNWVSLIENFNTTAEPNNRSLWMYRGVRWFPLGINDLTYKRDREFTTNFFLAVKRTKFVLVDLPTGEMDDATLDSLSHIDELWIFVDDDFDRQLDWKEFIDKTLITTYKMPIKLIHSRTTPNSRPLDVADKFKFPLIGELPEMYALVAANKHEKKPLINNFEAFKKLEPSFRQLANELIGEELDSKYKPNFWLKVKRKFLRGIDSN